jgi:hypothetical protein
VSETPVATQQRRDACGVAVYLDSKLDVLNGPLARWLELAACCSARILLRA